MAGTVAGTVAGTAPGAVAFTVSTAGSVTGALSIPIILAAMATRAGAIGEGVECGCVAAVIRITDQSQNER